MYNVNEHITNYISFYLKTDVSFNFAVLIRGEWGSGKTWYIKNLIDKNRDKKFIYISLYGVTKISDIEESFFEQLHPVLASKGMKIAGKIVKGLIKASIKVDFDKDGEKDTTISTSIPGLDLPLSLKKLDNCTLIFDDLERCILPSDVILGYINQFVEHNNQKVIIIANEEEIGKDNEKGKRYFEIKEKVIGRSFDYKADLNSALNVFLQEAKSHKSKEVLEKNKNLISDLYNQAGYNNLRHLKQAIIDFHRFFSFWPKKCSKSPELVEHLISFFFIISFELKKGDIRENEISKIIYSSQEKVLLDKETKHDTSRKKYSILNSVYSPLGEKIWTDYFKKGFINNTEIEEAISNSPYFDENTPRWVKLWRYWDLDDLEFENIKSSYLDDIRNKKVEDVLILTHITGIFLNLADENLIDITKDETIQLGKNQINYLKQNGKLAGINLHDLSFDFAYGYQYLSLDSQEFKDYFTYLEAKIEEAKIDEYPNIANELLSIIEKSPSDFLTKVNSYGKIPILIHIKPKKFVDALYSIKNIEKRIISRALKERYLPYDNYGLVLEIDWLIKVQEELIKKIKNKKDSLSKRILESLAKITLNDSIELLKDTKNSK